MSRHSLVFRLLSLGAIVAVLSCTDGATAPEPAPQPEAGLLGNLLSATGLLQCRPMPTATSTEVIGPSGGTIRVGPHRLYIPPGALDAPTSITATAPSGTVNLVQFQPHGLTFDRPAYLTMSYANCGLVGWLLPGHIAYVDSGLNILDLLAGLPNPWQQNVTSRLDHFSGYAIAW